ncbi:anti-sigma factor family protein [Terriglobus saanensis]|uniref:Putative transmembrane anti-sigma factor n=1 Tax=Terriglobus saanensis (strain ATCC BAA-1853 / DSM 23119 / SP1PR4) TaxID=401053 RepID=E8V259_TERSS|nr:zf-HC2 domain-containing protein [Terriglobus saanensis]ADV84616.1 putative transmembrane anti-sigma factor [Terriglobus saanensis SP1PR4]
MTQTTQANEHLGPDQLSAFIDGELSSSESYEVQQHLTDCHECALRVLSATRLKAATARAAQQFDVPADALARLTAQLRPQEPKKIARIYSFRSATWAAAAAALVLAVSLLGWRQTREANTLSAELLDQHLAALSSGASPEVVSTDRHTVKPWFQGKLPFSFNLPDVLPADTTLKGGDLAYLNGQPAALLLFTIHKHEVSVFLTQRSGRPMVTVLPGTQSGFAMRQAMTHDLRIIAVSDVNPADLDLLVSALLGVQTPR